MKKLVLVSYNVGKLVEMQEIFVDLLLQIILVVELGLGDVEEIGLIFVENVLLKVCVVCEVIGLLVLVDDLGLIVDVFGGVFGLYSVCYVGYLINVVVNNVKLLDVMVDIFDGQCSVCFYVVIVLLCYVIDLQLLICEGCWEGQIICELCGMNGFGYNLVFLDIIYGLIVVEMELVLKNVISYCVIVLQQFKQQLVMLY